MASQEATLTNNHHRGNIAGKNNVSSVMSRNPKYNQITLEGCFAGGSPVFLMVVGFHPAEVL
jgi:hypothetical protein